MSMVCVVNGFLKPPAVKDISLALRELRFLTDAYPLLSVHCKYLGGRILALSLRSEELYVYLVELYHFGSLLRI